MSSARTVLKSGLGRLAGQAPSAGATFLIYHRVGGGSPDERDLSVPAFAAQLRELEQHDVVAIDDALDRLAAGDGTASVVLTFDDGFRDVYDHAWPLLRERRMPFTLYLATSYLGDVMHWDGSTAKAAGPALSWEQIDEMVSSGLCTVGNHTHRHVRPDKLSPQELDACTAEIERHVDVTPRHFAFPWGIPVPSMTAALADRFRSAVTGELGRAHPATPPLLLPRVPVRGSDPIEFFRAKLRGRLLPERTYAAMVGVAKRAGAHA